MEETIIPTKESFWSGEWQYPWERVEKQAIALREELPWKVTQEAQGETSNMVKELWEKKLKDAFHTALKHTLFRSLIRLTNPTPPVFNYSGFYEYCRIGKLIGRWKKWKVKALMIPTDEPASRRLEFVRIVLAVIESEIKEADIRLQADVTAMDFIGRIIFQRGPPLRAEAQPTAEAWINAQAVSLMKAEDWCMQSLNDTFRKLELDLMVTEEDLREKSEEEARVYAVVVSAVALLALVYLYLRGHIDKGGTKTHSPSSLESL